VEGGLRLVEHLAILAFPDSEEEKGQRGGGGPEFGAAWNFYFGLQRKSWVAMKKLRAAQMASATS